ncbi:hypothetical protein LWI29_037559 [Acer saccharum]|uniref:CCHC-type domain-containing protein n=1 Tax=Acer saccharum TaxID=4024 RepID=A0AA39VWB5_ACESA|nr:hypothetical protein LWI29_037559 [Acer saccharum]
MALRDDFEAVRGSMIHRNPLLNLSSAIFELLAEETCLKAMIGFFESGKKFGSPQVFVASNKGGSFNSEQSKFRTPKDECSYCHNKGHWKKDCPLIQNKSQDSQRALSSAPSGNDNSSHLLSLVVAEIAQILGVSPAPSASFVSNTADEPDDDVSLNTDNSVSLPFDSRPHIIHQYSHRNVQQSTSNVPPSDDSLSIDYLDVADPVTPPLDTQLVLGGHLTVACSPQGYILSQSKYAADVIARVGLSDSRIVDTPIKLNHKLSVVDGELLGDVTRYR